MTIAALLALVALAWFGSSRRPVAQSSHDPLTGLPVEQAYDTAIRLLNEGRAMESLPYFRRTRDSGAPLTMRFHHNFGSALFNAQFETDTLAGVVRPALRHSQERVAVMRECLEHQLEAVRLAQSSADRAFYAYRLGRTLQVWGFQWEACLWFQQAADDDPGKPEYSALVAGMVGMLRDPVLAPSEVSLEGEHLPR